MLTPFTKEKEVDYKALKRLIDWYIEGGAVGLFAVCQSSEMFQLSKEEKKEIAKFVKDNSTVPVIASGHTSYSLAEQISELNDIADTGVDAVILITSLLARQDESDDVLINRLNEIIQGLPEKLPLGLYECPFPYKRLLTPKVIDYIIQTERFYFIKDTCCDLKLIESRLKQIEVTKIKLYNANTSTFLGSLQAGASGYSGVMANFHPKLYNWVYKNWDRDTEKANFIQSILTMCSFIEMKNYPENAKYALKLMGLPIEYVSRKFTKSEFDETAIDEIKQLNLVTDTLTKLLERDDI